MRPLREKTFDVVDCISGDSKPLPLPTLEQACRTLETGMRYARVLAVQRLGTLGEAALVPLCRALEDPCLPVRVAAADALGTLADARAVPALHAALRRSTFIGMGAREVRWERFWRWTGPVAATLALATTALHATDTRLGLAATCAMGMWSLFTLSTREWRRDHQPLQCALVHALHRIAEADAGPELRSCLPELKALAEIGWAQTRAGAPTLAATLKLVDTLPDVCAYPLPATAERAPTFALPRVTDAHAVSSDELPLPTNDGGTLR